MTVSTLSDLESFIENQRGNRLFMCFVSQERVSTDANKLITDFYNGLKTSKKDFEIKDIIIIAEHCDESENIIHELYTKLLGLDAEQTIHIFILNRKEYISTYRHDYIREVFTPIHVD